jgi:hypothetical protein
VRDRCLLLLNVPAWLARVGALPDENRPGGRRKPRTACDPVEERGYRAQRDRALNLIELGKKYDGKEHPDVDERYSRMIRRACKHGIEFVLRARPEGPA